MPSSSIIRTAVIGYGLSAKIFHIPFIEALPDAFALYGIVQRRPTPDNNAAIDYPSIKTWTSSEEMVRNPDVDLVVVGSVPDDHFEQCKEALEAGKHVLCEKPFTPTAAEALELASLAKKKSLVLCVYQNRRWDSDFITVQSLIKNGALGRIVEFESHFDRYRPTPPTQSAATWKLKEGKASGVIYDLGSHLIDQIITLFGIPERVTGFLVNQRVYHEKGVGGEMGGDSCTIHLHYDTRGLLATIKAAVVSPEPHQLRFWVRGDKASFKKFDLDVQEDQLKKGIKPGHMQFGVEPASSNGALSTVDPDTGVFHESRVQPESVPQTYTEFYRLLNLAIRGEGPIPVTAEEASKVLKVIELAKQSSREGRTLPYDFSK